MIVLGLALTCYASVQCIQSNASLKDTSVDVQNARKCDAATDLSSVRGRARVKEAHHSNERFGAQTSKTLLGPDSDRCFLDHVSSEELM